MQQAILTQSIDIFGFDGRKTTIPAGTAVEIEPCEAVMAFDAQGNCGRVAPGGFIARVGQDLFFDIAEGEFLPVKH